MLIVALGCAGNCYHVCLLLNYILMATFHHLLSLHAQVNLLGCEQAHTLLAELHPAGVPPHAVCGA